MLNKVTFKNLSSKPFRLITFIKCSFRLISIMGCIISGVIVWSHSMRLDQIMPGVHISPEPFHLRVRIFSAFLLSAIFAWRFKLWRLVVSMLFLLWILVEHRTWYLHSQDGLKFADIKELPPPSALGFYGGTWWDISLLISACILLVVEIFLIYKEAATFQKREKTFHS